MTGPALDPSASIAARATCACVILQGVFEALDIRRKLLEAIRIWIAFTFARGDAGDFEEGSALKKDDFFGTACFEKCAQVCIHLPDVGGQALDNITPSRIKRLIPYRGSIALEMFPKRSAALFDDGCSPVKERITAISNEKIHLMNEAEDMCRW